MPVRRAFLVSLCLVACGSDPTPSVYVDEAPSRRVASLPIDTGQVLDVAVPGVGLGIEYAGDGQWHVFTMCDTKFSNYVCGWDVLVLAPEDVPLEVDESSLDELEEDDTVVRIDDAGVRLLFWTTTDMDGIRFTVPADTPVQFDPRLDEASALMQDVPLYNWVLDCTPRREAPANRLELVPALPGSDGGGCASPAE